eukprot:GEMP01023819.1.p1 GENE.GEMP01023819.1~~GEMP01023819.1.p1  ORF type:complete len:639 (+),score=148.79 GEMP01023819.1:22-1938(+)
MVPNSPALDPILLFIRYVRDLISQNRGKELFDKVEQFDWVAALHSLQQYFVGRGSLRRKLRIIAPAVEDLSEVIDIQYEIVLRDVEQIYHRILTFAPLRNDSSLLARGSRKKTVNLEKADVSWEVPACELMESSVRFNSVMGRTNNAGNPPRGVLPNGPPDDLGALSENELLELNDFINTLPLVVTPDIVPTEFSGPPDLSDAPWRHLRASPLIDEDINVSGNEHFDDARRVFGLDTPSEELLPFDTVVRGRRSSELPMRPIADDIDMERRSRRSRRSSSIGFNAHAQSDDDIDPLFAEHEGLFLHPEHDDSDMLSPRRQVEHRRPLGMAKFHGFGGLGTPLRRPDDASAEEIVGEVAADNIFDRRLFQPRREKSLIDRIIELNAVANVNVNALVVDDEPRVPPLKRIRRDPPRLMLPLRSILRECDPEFQPISWLNDADIQRIRREQESAQKHFDNRTGGPRGPPLTAPNHPAYKKFGSASPPGRRLVFSSVEKDDSPEVAFPLDPSAVVPPPLPVDDDDYEDDLFQDIPPGVLSPRSTHDDVELPMADADVPAADVSEDDLMDPAVRSHVVISAEKRAPRDPPRMDLKFQDWAHGRNQVEVALGFMDLLEKGSRGEIELQQTTNYGTLYVRKSAVA